MRKLSLLLVAVLLTVLLPGLSVAADAQNPVEITYLHCWNGGSVTWPADQVNNPVMQKIIENTGVVLKMEGIITSETERLNTMFASGVIPDLVNAPYWGTLTGEGKVIKDAAVAGLIYDLTDILPNYPNVARLFEVGVEAGFKKNDLYHPDYNGRVYVIPQQTPSDDPKDVTNWIGTVWVRGDIIKALNVDTTQMFTPEMIYDLAVEISKGGFTDTVGNPVIPMGTWHNGWSYTEFVRGYATGYTISDWRMGEDGEIYHYYFEEKQEEDVLFMRRLLSEGLLDVECFSNTDTLAKEKMAVGKIAMFGSHAPHQLSALRATLYETNPEMEYVPLLQKNKAGDVLNQVNIVGRSGFPCMFIGYDSPHVDEVMRVLDYLNGDEGRMVAKYGIEGVHYDLNEQGIPITKQVYLDAWEKDVTARYNLGIDSFAYGLIGAYDYQSRFPQPEDAMTYWDKLLEQYREERPIIMINKMSVNWLVRSYPDFAQYQDNISTLNFEDERKRAFYAESDEAALKILNDARQRYLDAGLDKLTEHMQETYDALSGAEKETYGF